jgi:hypothetical protein
VLRWIRKILLFWSTSDRIYASSDVNFVVLRLVYFIWCWHRSSDVFIVWVASISEVLNALIGCKLKRLRPISYPCYFLNLEMVRKMLRILLLHLSFLLILKQTRRMHINLLIILLHSVDFHQICTQYMWRILSKFPWTRLLFRFTPWQFDCFLYFRKFKWIFGVFTLGQLSFLKFQFRLLIGLDGRNLIWFFGTFCMSDWFYFLLCFENQILF